MRSLLLTPILFLVACGGGSGSGTATGTDDQGVLGTRALPGGKVTVRQTAPSMFSIALAIPDVQSVEVLQGDDYATAQPVATVTGADGAVSGTVPPGTALLVRVTRTDGSVMESASGDYRMP